MTGAVASEFPLLDVRGLSVSIATHGGVLTPVRSVDLRVEMGRTHAVVGESGCGKSLTALALMGLLPRNATVEAERIDLAGRSLLGLSQRAWRRIRGARVAMVFQDPMTALDPSYRVGDQMTEVLRQHERVSRAAAWERARDLLREVGVPSPAERLDQYPHEMSGGLRQRVMIATALLCEPDLILADEPTTALDVTVQAQILALLREICERRGVGILLITHDLGVVASVADRVSVMYGGEVVETGATRDVLASPLHPYTEGLLNALPVPGRTPPGTPLGFIPGVVPRQAGALTRCGFIGRCPYRLPACGVPVPLTDAAGEHRRFRCVLPPERPREAERWHLREVA